VARFVRATNHERREAANPESLTFVAISLERVVRGTVFQGPRKCLDVKAGLLCDRRLDVFPVNASSLEAPRLPQSTEVPPSLIGALEIRGFRRDARGPRRIEVVGGVDHRVRRHGHAMLARDRLEERAHGVLPAAAGHARPLLPDGAEVLEAPALPPP